MPMLNSLPWPLLLVLAGIGQLVLAAASLAIPRMLRWSEETARLRPLTRQVFWTYAGYIWTTNLCFGLVSALGPAWLLDHSPLAAVVTAFIACYWGARLLIQLVWFDRTDVPPHALIRPAEAALTSLFLLLTLIYGGAAVVNLGGGP
jgi:hypothetical protein